MISDTASEAMASITYNTSGTRLPVLCTALKILITSKLLARQQKIVSSLHFFTSASVPNLLHSQVPQILSIYSHHGCSVSGFCIYIFKAYNKCVCILAKFQKVKES